MGIRHSSINRLVAGQFVKKLGKTINGVCSQSTKRMAAYSWPGNIRELQNVLERSAILARGNMMEIPESAFPVTNNSTLSEADLSPLGSSNTGHGSLASIEKPYTKCIRKNQLESLRCRRCS
jgi:DNA-binding NtrC family response regulator